MVQLECAGCERSAPVRRSLNRRYYSCVSRPGVRVFRTLLIAGLIVLGLYATVVTTLVLRRSTGTVVAAAIRDLQSNGVLVRELLRDLQEDEAERVTAGLAGELGVRFTLVRQDGSVAADTAESGAENLRDRPEISEALAGRVGTSIRESEAFGDTMVYVAIPAAGEPYIVRTSRAYAEIGQQVDAVRDATLLVTVGAGAGALLLLLGFARRLDVRLTAETLAKQQEQTHRLRAEQMFRDFIETTTEWVWAVDESFIVTYSNPAVKQLLGYAAEELIGGPLHAFVHPDEREQVQREVASLAASRSGWRDLVYRWRHKDGTFRYLESAAVPIVAADGTLQGYRGADRDVTDRREAERMKSDFVSFVSHQLRTPLAGMKWMMELAAGAQDVPAEAREYIGEAQASADRLSRLVNELLDIARLESGRFVLSKDEVPLDAVTREVVTQFDGVAREKGVTLSCDICDAAVVHADAQMMHQVVTNLVSNAIKYTPPGGRIAVSLALMNGMARWRVADTGMGIPKGAQSRLFEKFFRADNAISLETEGTGLGLHLVRLIVEHSGGRIWCESEEGRGATFTFTLPAHEAHA
jgi:PAS domain S-box-containing protein